MNILKRYGGPILHSLVLNIQDEFTISNISSSIILIIMFFQRASLLFPINEFANQSYKDEKLIILSGIANWFTLQTPLGMIGVEEINLLFLVYLGVVHWIGLIASLSINLQPALFKLALRKYYTYFHTIILLPSIVEANSFLIRKNLLLGLFAILPMVFNSIILFLISRNYSLPVLNPYHRRYSVFNIIISISDITLITASNLVNEQFQTLILSSLYFIMILDSHLIQVYPFFDNIKYGALSCLLFLLSIVKLASFGLDQANILYFMIIISPFGAIACYLLNNHYMEQYLLYGKLTITKIYHLVDVLYSNKVTVIQKQMLLGQILKQYNIQPGKKKEFTDLAQNVVLQLFDRLFLVTQINSRYTQEDLFLYKSLFLIKTCKQPTLGYINLKKFQSNSRRTSYYFHIISEILQNEIKKQTQGYTQEQEKSLDAITETIQLFDVRKIEILYESAIGIIYQIIDEKTKFWNQLLSGYQKIEEFCSSASQLSKLIWSLQRLVFNQLNISPLQIQKSLNQLNALELKLLSFVHSVILNDYHCTLDIELRIAEILNYERNITSDTIRHTTLLKDELVLLSTSIIQNRGQILNKNRAALALFFCYDDEKDFQGIQYIDQLMPKFIQSIHDLCLSKYLDTGFSSIFDQAREVYYIEKNKSIKPANLSLVHIYENVNDYIITGALQKIKEGIDLIIFDSAGKIVATTQNICHILLDDAEKTNLMEQSYIYFWFHQIIDQINEEKEDLFRTDAFAKNLQQKQHNIYPVKQIAGLVAANNSFKKQKNWNLSQQESHVQKSRRSESADNRTVESADEEFHGVQVKLLKPSYRQNVQFFLTEVQKYDLISTQHFYNVKYTITVRLFGPNRIPNFIVSISEISKKIKNSGNQGFSNTFNQSSAASTIKRTEILYQSSYIPETQGNEDDNPPGIVVNESLINKLIPIEEQSRLKEAHMQSHFQGDAQLISPRGEKNEFLDVQDAQEEDFEQEEEEIKLDGHEKSSSQKQKVDVKEILKQNKQQIIENNEQDVNKSKTSATSDRTQNSIFNILRQLQYTQKYQTTIIKAIVNTVLLFLILAFLCTTQLVLNRFDTNNLQLQIPLVRLPDRFNRLYCTFVTLGQMDLLQKLLQFDYSQYYRHRIKVESQERRKELLEVIGDLKVSFSNYENDGEIEMMKIKVMNEYRYEEVYGQMIYFDTMVNENTQRVNYYIQKNDSSEYQEQQITLQFLKGNLYSQIQLSRNLIDQIVEEFFLLIDNNEFKYLMIMMVELAIITTMLIIQFKFWSDPYIYMQNILLLISRVSEKDIEILNLKYKQIKEKLTSNQNRWKQIDYFKDIYNYRLSDLKKFQKLQQQSQIAAKTDVKVSKGKAKLTSRIQDTTFKIWFIYLMLFTLWGIFLSYSISSFIFQYTNMIGSYPELELCMQFVSFKAEFDSVMILGQLAKNQHILTTKTAGSGVFSKNPELNDPNKYFAALFQEILSQFNKSYTASYDSFKDLYMNIVLSEKIDSNSKAKLLGLYQDDFCQFIEDLLPFCRFENGKFYHFPDFPEPYESDNNRQRFKYGLNGIAQEVDAIIQTYYVSELQGQKDDNIEQVMKFIMSPEYNQLINAYFFDINKAIVEFFVTIVESSLNILESNFQNALIYKLIFGFMASITLFVIIIWRAVSLQTKIRAVRQALIVLPHENLLDQQTYNAIKRFERNM